MERDALKELTYGGLTELIKNRKFYYHSSVGPTYSYWTEDGEKALVEYMNMIGWKMIESEEKELDQRAKDMVINGLKGEKI